MISALERYWADYGCVLMQPYHTELAAVGFPTGGFDEHGGEARPLVERRLPLPAYDQVLKCSHTFNLLDARGAISANERAAYIGRVRKLARATAESYLGSQDVDA